MPDRHVLDRAFFARPSPLVARELIGAVIRSDEVEAEIVETEAYDQCEPAAHSFRGPTARTQVMFGPAGHVYTYFVYGMHWCANIVTGQPGQGQAVLLRAARVISGEDTVRARRRGRTTRKPSARDLLRGPARLASGLGIGRADNGADLLAATSRLRLAGGEPTGRVSTGPRVGVRHAADLRWRFWLTDSPQVSMYRRHPKASPPENLDGDTTWSGDGSQAG